MKIDRNQLRRMIINEIKSLQEETEPTPTMPKGRVPKRGGSFDHPGGGQKEYKLRVPGGYPKMMFAAEKEITVNGMTSKLVQGQHRISVRTKGSTYYIESDAQNIKVKPVR